MYIIFRFTNVLLFTAVTPYTEHFMHSIAQQPPVGQGLFIVALGRTPRNKHSARKRPLPDSTQHYHETHIHALGWIRTSNAASNRPQTDALDSVTTGTVAFDIKRVRNNEQRRTRLFFAVCETDYGRD